MRKIVAQLVTTLIVASTALAGQFQNAPNANAPGAAYFAQADQELAKNTRADVLPQIQQGWAAVRAVGPTDPGFARGVASAVRLFRAFGRDLDAESVYQQAILSCDTPESAGKRKTLRYMFVQDLIANREYVKAETILRAAVADEESSPARSPLYVAFLQNLSFVREQEGELDDAERILRSTIGLAAPELKDVVMTNVWFSHWAPLPMTGDPNEILASFYERHARPAEAESLLRNQLTRTEGNRNLHLIAMHRLAMFLSVYRSGTEAVDLQKQILSRVQANQGSLYELESEKTTLARYEAAAGQGDQAKQLLENNLLQAENSKGRGSLEYRMALNDLFENRRSASDYETAEKLAKQQLDDVEQSDHPDPNSLVSALSQLAQVKQMEGHKDEADELQRKALEEMHLANPGRGWELQDRFSSLGKMIQSGIPAGQAVAEVQNIINAYFPFVPGELSQFQLVAQNLLAQQHKPEAVQVAEIISSLQQREGLDADPRFATSLVEWAGFYAGQFGDRARGKAILENARNLILECCGENSPKLEFVLREEPVINENPAAVTAALERLRDFQVSVFGAHHQSVEATTVQLAHSASDARDWEHAKELYRRALKINAHRTGSRGVEYVQLLSAVSMEFFSHHDYQTALELNQRAMEACTGFVWADQTRRSLEQRHRQIAGAMMAAKR
jgi:tetratricopeptide (TPR) repeat protein